MKIKKIEVKNFKAVSEQSIDFNGCSAIITAGNNKGKSSLLRGLIDRIRGEKPDLIVKQGESKGFNIIELTDGSKIEWKFTEKSESFAFITKEGIKQTTGVLKAISDKYFGQKFDIDKFLNSAPKQQIKELQNIVGLDFTNIDNRYSVAYEERTIANRLLSELRSHALTEPVKVENPEIEKLKSQLQEIKTFNDNLKREWDTKNEKHLQEIQDFNKQQESKRIFIKGANIEFQELSDFSGSIFNDCIDLQKAKNILDNLEKPQPEKPIKNLPAPDYKPTNEIEEQIQQANEQLRKYDAYIRDLSDYNNWLTRGKEAKEKYNLLDSKVKEIESEKKKMISDAKIPTDFEINNNDILYKGLPLTNSQQSSSAKYIAALKLGSMVLGEIRTMHFDASFLDKNSLSEIQNWANDNDLQLLIERPDFDGGEIKYDIITE